MTAASAHASQSNHCYFRNDVRVMTVRQLILLVLFWTPWTDGAYVPQTTAKRPLICNNGTLHQCVCTPGSYSESIVSCDYFVAERELPVVDMRARHVNLEAHLHTNENYEQYFRRRIAQIVSSYCERQINECPGVAVKLEKNEGARVDDSVLYAADESEPLLTQDNVVILQVDKEAGNMTRILFAIAKSDKAGALTINDIIDPQKVKVILGSQAVPLSRILGGIRLDSVRTARVSGKSKAKDGDNTKLLYFIGVVGTFFVICWIIGFITLLKEHRRQRRTKEEKALAKEQTPDYGTLPRDRKASRNGVTKSTAMTAQNEISYQHIDEPIPECFDDEPHVLTERQARFMFMCDPSQLPRLPTFDSTEGPEEPDLKRYSFASTSSREKSPSTLGIQEQEHADEPAHKTDTIDSSHAPALVIVSSPSIRSETPSSPVIPPTTQPDDLLRGESPPIDRPRSRRGSRIDEEDIDLTELGKKDLFTDLVIPVDIQTRIQDMENERPGSADRWSSSEGEVDIYYKMSDDEEIRGDEWPNKHHRTADKEVIAAEADEESEGEQEHKPSEDAEHDAFGYERLREEASPMPPKDS